MASYLKSTHTHTHTHTHTQPAVLPPSMLQLSPVSAVGGGGEVKRVVWDVLDAVAAGVVTVEGIEVNTITRKNPL